MRGRAGNRGRHPGAWFAIAAAAVALALALHAPTPDTGEKASPEGRQEYYDALYSDGGSAELVAAWEELKSRQSVLRRDAGLWEWTSMGPGNIGGRVRAILLDPDFPSTIWLGGVSGGIWKTTDAGQSWRPINDFLPSLAVTDLVMTADDQYIFASTGEGQAGGGLQGAGIFRSADAGESWTQLPIPDAASFRWVHRLAVHPTRDGEVWAITRNGEVWSSADDGMNWKLEIDIPWRPTPTGSSLYYRGYDIDVTENPATGNTWVVASFRDSCLMSTDDGSSWTALDNNSGGLPQFSNRIEIAFGYRGPGLGPSIYASVNRNGGEVWRSWNAGASFTLQNSGTNYLVGGGGNNQGDYDNIIWADPANPNRIVVGGIDLWSSTDAGVTLDKSSEWQNYHTGSSAHADQHEIFPSNGYNSVDNFTLYFGNDGGIQVNRDIWGNGKNQGWENRANDLRITQFYAGAARTDLSVVIGGTQDNSTVRYTGSINGWDQDFTGDGGFCAISQLDPDLIFATTQVGGLYRSRNGGNGFNNISNNVPNSGNGNNWRFISPLAMEPGSLEAIWYGGDRIYRSADEGANFTQVRGPIANNERCSAIAFSPNSQQWIWLGYENGTVSRNLDSTPNWANVEGTGGGGGGAQVGALPDRQVTDIAVHPNNNLHAIVALSTFGGQALWETTDGGNNWSDITGTGTFDLPDVPVNTVTFHPDNPDWIYVGTELGVFASEDGGQNWSTMTNSPVAEGPANTRVTDLFWANNHTLIAATFGRGMYRSSPLVAVYVDQAHLATVPQLGTAAWPAGTVELGLELQGIGSDMIIEGATYDEPALLFGKRGLVTGRNGTVLIR